jgi:hypothetical protein
VDAWAAACSFRTDDLTQEERVRLYLGIAGMLDSERRRLWRWLKEQE